MEGRRIRTRLTDFLGIDHPILSAPMAGSAGGRLAASVSVAGGLGLIGGGYGDEAWLEREFAEAGNTRVGCGFITWSLARQPAVLERALAHAPKLMMLSFGDPTAFAPTIKTAGCPLMCQVQTLTLARQALDCGADILIAQGAEAGGHGSQRATMTLVPEIADLLSRSGSNALLVAAGGIADGRGLAAALMLGADGVLMGTRFWASAEALVHDNHHAAAVAASGDHTVRQSATDIVRRLDWPEQFTIRVVRNAFTDRWVGDEAALRERIDELHAGYLRAVADGHTDIASAVAGEAIGLIDGVRPAADIVADTVAQAASLLRRGGGMLV